MNNSKSSNKDLEKEVFKEENESIFLPNKEKVTYNSIILLEIFTFEEFPELIKFLDIYSDKSDLDIKKIKNDLRKSTGFKGDFKQLSPIFNSKFNNSSPSFDLGDKIDRLEVKLLFFSYSLVIMQIQVILMPNISDRLNNIIYTYYTKDEIEKYDPPSTFPVNYKCRMIFNLRKELKEEIIEYLSDFLKGKFIKLSKNRLIIPSIDLYSLHYPNDIKDILKWGKENIRFLDCFNAGISGSYKYDEYILCVSEYIEIYTIFANKGFIDEYLYRLDGKSQEKSDEDINQKLSWLYFDEITILNLVYVFEDVIEDLHLTISNEIQKLETNKLEEILESRKEISKKIFQFKRLKNEIRKDKFMPNFFEILEKNKEMKNNFTDEMIVFISEKANYINDTIDTLNQNANLILNLKNIEFSKKIQDRTLLLSILVGILAVIQLIIAYQLK